MTATSKCFLTALSAVMALNGALTVSAQSPMNWSGVWVSHGAADLTILRSVHLTARGWDNHAQALATAASYAITIAQTPGEVVISFPGGANNMMTVPGFAMADHPRTVVISRGSWWIKHVTAGRWADESLELTSTSSGGWHREAAETAAPAETDFIERLTVTPGDQPDRLRLHVVVSDEKGELEYVQRFARSDR